MRSEVKTMIKRFSPVQRLFHVMLILSFLTLA